MKIRVFHSYMVYGNFKHKLNFQICEFRTSKKSFIKLFSRPKRPIVNLVDQRRKTWNTFIEISLEWEPALKQIYEAQNCEPDSP